MQFDVFSRYDTTSNRSDNLKIDFHDHLQVYKSDDFQIALESMIGSSTDDWNYLIIDRID